MPGTSKRGFAAMDEDKQRQIASKGGVTVSRDRDHMAAIGRKGGESRADDPDIRSGSTGRKGGSATSRDREHMVTIGRRGGRTTHGVA